MVERLAATDPVAGPFLTFFLREDSFPLDSDRLGEPGRLRDLGFFRMSVVLCLPDGVVLPLVLAPEASFSFSSASFLASSSFSSSFSLSESESDYTAARLATKRDRFCIRWATRGVEGKFETEERKGKVK